MEISKNKPQNVFLSAEDFMNPENHPPTPLVLLPEKLNPFSPSDKVKIFLKAMYLTPVLNLKWSPAFNMLSEAKKSGRLKGVHTLVEGSSGNMVLSLALAAKAFGIKKVQAIVPADIAFVKKEILHIAGVELIYSTESRGQVSAIEKARELGRQKGFLNLAQYENKANPAAHEKWTAAEIFEQLDGKLTVFCAGLGTTGTAVGVRNFFQKQKAKVATVGAVCAPGSAVPGVRSEKRLSEIRFNWRRDIYKVEVETKEAFKASRDLILSGFLAGPSSGFALRGLIKFLELQKRFPSAWKKLHNEDGEIIAAFVAGDTSHLYVDKYSTILDPQDFETS